MARDGKFFLSVSEVTAAGSLRFQTEKSILPFLSRQQEAVEVGLAKQARRCVGSLLPYRQRILILDCVGRGGFHGGVRTRETSGAEIPMNALVLFIRAGPERTVTTYFI